MTTERDFLRAISDVPDDDSLRLVFADWLDDHDKPAWAALIRRQVAEYPADPDEFHLPHHIGRGDRRPTLSGDALAAVAADMAYPVPLDDAVFHRGLVDQLPLPADTFLDAAEALAAWGPVPMVLLYGVRDHLDRLAGWDAPAGLTRLDLEGADLADDELQALVDSRLFAGLRELSLDDAAASRVQPADVRITEAASGILARAPGLAGLRRLRLGCIPCMDDGLVELSRSAALRNLTWLTLTDCSITGTAFYEFNAVPWPHLRLLSLANNPLSPEGSDALVGSPQLGPLRRLDLSASLFPSEAVPRLAGSLYLVHLRELLLYGTYLTGDGFRALIGSAALSGLRRLAICPCDQSEAPSSDIDPSDAATLARATFADTLESLDLYMEHVGDEGVVALVRSGRFGQLKELNLPHCGIGPAGARALLNWPAASRVAIDVAGNPMGADGVELIARLAFRDMPAGERGTIDLRMMGVGDAGMARLVGLPELALCRGLLADENGITADGVVRLASCPEARHLERLWLRSNPIGDAGAKALADSPHLGGLRELVLAGCQLTDAGVVALAGSANFAHLEYLDLSGTVYGDAAAFALADCPSLALRTLHFDRFGCGPAARAALNARFPKDDVPF